MGFCGYGLIQKGQPMWMHTWNPFGHSLSWMILHGWVLLAALLSKWLLKACPQNPRSALDLPCCQTHSVHVTDH